ncbi:unnamed protein product, partial [Ectocarpus sp. 8 AP-2014]
MVGSSPAKGSTKRALSTTAAVGSAEKDKKHKRTGNTLSSPLHRGIDGPPRPGEVKLLISNLHYEVSLDLLASEFSTCGAVMRCRIINGPDGRSRGVAFVSFGEKSSADRAISKYHDR